MVSSGHPLLQGLNEPQCAAVTAADGPLLILAGPGSGKTRVLTHRIAWVLSEQQQPPWQMLAVTFTNKAAREMRERLERMLGQTAAAEMSIGTFHATCARVLRRESEAAGLPRDYLIFDADDQLAVMKLVVKEMNLDDKRYPPSALLNAVSHAKNELIPPSEYPTHTYYDEIVLRAYTRYQETLRTNNALDFDDLLVEPVRLFRSNPEILEKYRQRFRCILVDEFQDTNMAQYVLLRLLSEAHRSLFVVADEDQSIYSWRGADYRNIHRLRQDYPELRVILLEQNYRSTQRILDAAQAVIAQNPDRTEKHLFTTQKGGVPLALHEAYDEIEEASFVADEIWKLQKDGHTWSDIAVMYRTNAQSRAIEEALVHAGIPYRLIGGTRFYARKEIKDLLSFLRLAQNPNDDVSFMRVVGVPPRGIGARTLAKVTEQATASGCSAFAAVAILAEQRELPGRTLQALREFTDMLGAWHEARDRLTVSQLLDHILADTGYARYLRDGTEDGESRWENVMALQAVALEAGDASLVEFLTEVALVADVDALTEAVEAVTLLTLHSAKGLEYPVVFITGLEDGMLPHSRSIEQSPQAVAEERRLFYVGMTRAREQLYLSHAFQRHWYGSSEPSRPSRFLQDLPDSVLEEQGRPAKKAQAGTGTGWGAQRWGETLRMQRSRHEPEVEQRFHAGQRVRHRHFGAGTVQDSRIEHGDELVTVLFFDTGVGVKQFLAGVAPLEPASEH